MKLEPKLLELLNKRGIRTEEDVEEFLSDRPQKTHDPFLLHNMEAGVDLILSVIREGGKICIYGDYDADGITSTVVMMEVLSHLTDKLTYYIPSRFEEGYGMNKAAVDRIAEMGVSLILTVDCGSVSVDEVNHAKELGMQVLVTDHHTVTDVIADCLVINPNQPDCNYPCPYLAGCGVAFKFCQALIRKAGLPKSILNRTLDVVGIGTIGDIVPLVDENRTLAKYGLRAINTSARKNLKKLIEAVGLHPGQVHAENVSFVIVPHLNAAGRMLHAKLAVEMFLSQDEDEVDRCIARLCACNNDRKRIQEETYRRCVEQIEERFPEDRFLLVDMQDAHEGITGIVAGKVKERYYRPTVIVTPTGDGLLKGTGRSIEGVNLYQELKKSEELFLRFGGHAAACGFTIREEDLETLRRRLNEQMDQLDPQLFCYRVHPDLEVKGDELNLELVEQLQMLEPCGCGNERPVIGVTGSAMYPARMGSQGQFMRFTAMLDHGKRLPCVVFSDADQAEEAIDKARGADVQIAGMLGTNEWNGRTSLQMIVRSVME